MRMGKGANKHTWTLDNLEVRTVTRSLDDGQPIEQPVIKGYAAVYNSESELLYGFFREVIRPGAFDSSLKNDVRCLWDHNSSYVLGRTTSGTLDIRSDAKGLYFEVTPPETQWANDLCQSIKRGDVNQMSFGFVTKDDSWQSLEDGTEMRELLEVDLQEVSVVTFPAYQATSAGMRSIDSEDEEVKKRVEERKEDKPSGPKKRYLDYLKILEADIRATDKKAKDEEVEQDPATETDDPNNEDVTEDDEGDENGDEKTKK